MSLLPHSATVLSVLDSSSAGLFPWFSLRPGEELASDECACVISMEVGHREIVVNREACRIVLFARIMFGFPGRCHEWHNRSSLGASSAHVPINACTPSFVLWRVRIFGFEESLDWRVCSIFRVLSWLSFADVFDIVWETFAFSVFRFKNARAPVCVCVCVCVCVWRKRVSLREKERERDRRFVSFIHVMLGLFPGPCYRARQTMSCLNTLLLNSTLIQFRSEFPLRK